MITERENPKVISTTKIQIIFLVVASYTPLRLSLSRGGRQLFLETASFLSLVQIKQALLNCMREHNTSDIVFLTEFPFTSLSTVLFCVLSRKQKKQNSVNDISMYQSGYAVPLDVLINLDYAKLNVKKKKEGSLKCSARGP